MKLKNLLNKYTKPANISYISVPSNKVKSEIKEPNSDFVKKVLFKNKIKESLNRIK